MYLQSLKQFRGIAIVLIVAGHCLTASGWIVDSVADKWIANLVIGGTSLFVFLSGYLFHHVHASCFDYRTFLQNKRQRVLLPYLALSVPLVLYRVLFEGVTARGGTVPSTEQGFSASRLEPIASYVWTGKVLTGYWYIPFICVVFVLSPLVIRFLQLRPSLRITIVSLSLIASLTVQRPVSNFAVWQSVAYFLPVFLFGALASLHRVALLVRLQGQEVALGLCIGALALVQAYAYPNFGNLQKPAFQLALPDVLLAQKVLLCLFFMVLLHRFEDRPSRVLGVLASASFPIFFLHPWVIWAVEVGVGSPGGFKTYGPGPLLWLVLTSVVVLVSLGLAIAIRQTLRARSGWLIGW